jgi:hypothetical protein
LLSLFVLFNTLVIRDGIDPNRAHEAFLAIDEYRQTISPEIPGAEEWRRRGSLARLGKGGWGRSSLASIRSIGRGRPMRSRAGNIPRASLWLAIKAQILKRIDEQRE